MRGFLRSFLLLFFVTQIDAQVATNTGSIYGKVVDEKKNPIAGVNIELSSDIMPNLSAASGVSGSFRFASLPPGNYSASIKKEGFTEIRQEGIRITVGLNIELEIIMKESPVEEIAVIGETPLLDTQKTGNSSIYSTEYLENIPGGRDPWFVLEMTPGIDSDRYNVAGSESGNQSAFFARGGNNPPIWNYDGINFADFGGAPAYFNFDSFEEIEIQTGGNDASIQSGGVVINLITKRGGNQWEGNASYYYVNDALQSDNTPQELIENPIPNPITGEPAKGANRTHEINEYSLDLGGPLILDKLFVWGAISKNRIEQFSIQDVPDNTTLTDYNFKANFNFNSENETQFGYLWANKDKYGREVFPGDQAPEALWNQEGNLGTTTLPGIWSLQHNWIPTDHTLISLRYGYVSTSWGNVPVGGKDVSMIFLESIPRWEDTFYYISPVERQTHDINGDLNYFKENWFGGDHEFKFGFVYSRTNAHTFSSYGNGVLIVDYYQTTPGGPLTSGYVKAQHYIDSTYVQDQTGFYFTDTYRKDRITLNLGLRFDRQAARNKASSIPAVPGYEQYVGAFDYPGGDPGIVFNDFSPRAGMTFDLNGDGKTILRGNFARYYNEYNPGIIDFSDPTYTYNGAIFFYENQNGNREITLDELAGSGDCSLSDPCYYGGLTPGGFDLEAFLSKRLYSNDLSNNWTNEVIAGIERQIGEDFSASATYTYRRYGDILTAVPFGISTADYVPGGIFHKDTPIGTFNVPYFVLGFQHDGTGIVTNAQDYRRSYHGVDLSLKKRVTRNFLLNGSLTLQTQKAHYNSPDALGFMPFIAFPGSAFAYDPTNLPFVDDQTYSFSGRFGIRPFSEWYLKISGYYELPWQIAVGGFLRYQQGYPYVIFGQEHDATLSEFYNTNTHIFLVEPFGSRRLENKFTLDLRMEKGIDIGEYGRITGIIDVFNITNENAVIRRNTRIRTADFNQIQEVIAPRAVRFGLRYSF